MSDASSEPENGIGRPGATSGMPRWVKVSLLVVLGLVALFVVLTLVGAAPGGHGPRRHLPGGDAPSTSAPAHGPAMHDR